MSLQSFPIVGLTKGLKTDVKPAMLPDQAYAILNNAYTFRERELKREGRKFLGRLRRVFTGLSLGTSGAAPWSFNIYSKITPTFVTSPSEQKEIEPGSVIITVGAQTFTDQGNGILKRADGNTQSYINYITGDVVLYTTSTSATTINFNYYPTLPETGITQEELPTLNAEQTIWFDTVYAYIWNGTGFQEFIPGTTWAGQSQNLFWATNYRGASAFDRLLFVTNDVNDAADPIRYTDGATWTSFAPLITSSTSLFQCLMIIPYYGRLLAFNTWEGTTSSGAALSQNYFNRCRFSQLGDPTDQTNGWRVDIFGRGGSLDAPVNEQIVGAIFIKNTLVVDFERSTWQLRYVGEYGNPFLWERVSADFGSESTFSGVLFDNHRLAVGDKAITAGNGNSVNRIDLDIPDQVFNFKNSNFGVQRVTGIRDYKKELVFWNYPDAQTQAAFGIDITFPNTVLVYNYRNNTWATFDDSVTCFGTFQSSTNITWSNLAVFWDDEDITWSDSDSQSEFPIIVCGNQQGFVSCFQYATPSNLSTVDAIDQETLTITAITLTTNLITITSPNHNLQQGDCIYITGLTFLDSTLFTPVTTTLNNAIYRVNWVSSPSVNQFTISVWDFNLQNYKFIFPYAPLPSTALYVGGGRITKFPKLNILTKDINLFQGQSLQTKLSRLDFLFEPQVNASVTVNLYLNSSTRGSTPGSSPPSSNVAWQSNMSIDAVQPFYTQNSDYSWFRLYATLAAQYFNINITYDDNLMNTLITHQSTATLYAINAWCRPGGKIVF